MISLTQSLKRFILNKERFFSIMYFSPIFLCYISINYLGVFFYTYLQFISYPLIILLGGSRFVLMFVFSFGLFLFFNAYHQDCVSEVVVLYESIKIALYLLTPIVVLNKVRFDYVFDCLIFCTKFSVVIVFLSFFLNYLTGVSFFIDYGYSQERYHALLTEPSALAIPISILLVQSIIDKRFYWIIFCLTSIVLIKSIIVLFLGALSIFSIFVIRKLGFKIVTLSLIVMALFSKVFITVSNIEFLYDIDERLYSGMLAIMTLGESGYNPRVITAMSVIDVVENKNALLSGFGFGIGDCNSINMTWKYDSNIITYLFYSSGIIGLTIYICVLIALISMLNWKSKVVNEKECILFVITFLGVLINGAQGLLYFSMHLLSILYLIKKFRSENER